MKLSDIKKDISWLIDVYGTDLLIIISMSVILFIMVSMHMIF